MSIAEQTIYSLFNKYRDSTDEYEYNFAILNAIYFAQSVEEHFPDIANSDILNRYDIDTDTYNKYIDCIGFLSDKV